MALNSNEVDPQARDALSQAFTSMAAKSDFAPLSDGAYFTQLGQQSQNQPVGVTPAPTLMAQAPAVASKIPLMVNIEEQLKRATEATDTMEAANILGSVRGAIAKEAATFYSETQGVANAEFGIPRLSAQLEEAIRMDDMSPGYRQKYGQADSDETAAVRRQLLTSKAAADSSINERLAGNPIYQELMAKAKTAEQLVATRVQQDLNKDATKQAEADEFYYSRPPEERKLLDEATGNTDSDPRVAMANLKFIYKDERRKKALFDVLNGGEAELPKLSISGNPFAKRMAIGREAKVFGTPEIAASKIAEVEAVANDNNKALLAFTALRNAGALGIPAGPEVEKLTQNVTLLLGPAAGKTKADQEMQAKQRADIAIKFARLNAEKEFNSDIMALRHKSSIPVPSWLAAEAASGKVGKIDNKAAMALANKAPLEERRVRIQELSDYYNSAVDYQNKSMLFPVSAFAGEKLKAQATLLGVFGDAAEKVGELFPSFGAGGMEGQALTDYMKQQANR